MSSARSPIVRAAEGNPFPVLLVCLTGIAMLVVFAPSLIVGDTWLTLMAGREVVHDGLPATESITLLGRGNTWTDQQWLAQVVFYAAQAAAGVKAIVLVDIVLVLLTLSLCVSAARRSGATGRSTFLIALLGIAAGPWGWTVRAQVLALPLFAATLWLLADGSRRGIRARTLVVLPLLAVWANVHGSVILAAGLAALLGVVELARRRGPTWRPLALLGGAPLCVLASPYALELPAYYRLMLVDAPFSEHLREWQWSSPSWTTLCFYGLAGVAAALAAVPRSRARFTAFELIVLAVLLLAAVNAVRGIVWFALGAMIILPRALDGVIGRPDAAAPRLDRAISAVAVLALGAAFVVTALRPDSWFLTGWPERQIAAVRAASLEPGTRVFATDRHADWLLWRIPSLRGRTAFDVRFELYDPRTLDALSRYDGEIGADWKGITRGYALVVLDETSRPSHLDDFLAEPGARLVWRDDRLALVARAEDGG